MEHLRLLARRFALDILIVILAVGSAVEVALWHRDEYQSHPAWLAVPEIALVVVPLLGRRRFPFYAPAAVWLLAAAVSFTDGWLVVTPVSTFLAANVAAFLLGNVVDGLQARLGLALVLSGAVIIVGNKPDHNGSELVFIPVMFAIAWAAGYAVRERARHAEAAEQRAAHAEHDRQAAARAAAADERGRIARELHDTIAHAVSVMVLQVGAVRHQLPGAQEEHKNVLRDVEQTGRAALTDMRHLLDAMREDGGGVELAPQPGLDRLDGLLKEFGRAGLPVQLSIAGEQFPLPGGVDISAYRIVQEGLTNVLKHAQATEAEVALDYAPDQLSIEVRDNGRGAGHGNGGGHGLVGIRERVRLYDGEMTAGPQAGGGFFLRARLSLTRRLP
ncbi:MAG TPA: histidine kinase [Trebonia sp.]|jgi:signal transduction histidine kinase|nr:histidine kinase [Trebonia sp.]